MFHGLKLAFGGIVLRQIVTILSDLGMKPAEIRLLLFLLRPAHPYIDEVIATYSEQFIPNEDGPAVTVTAAELREFCDISGLNQQVVADIIFGPEGDYLDKGSKAN